MSDTVLLVRWRRRWQRLWRRWQGLSAEERRLALSVIRLWPVCRLTLHRRGAQAAADRLLPTSPPAPASKPAREPRLSPPRVAKLVDRMANRLPGGLTCLERSLVTASLLRHRGVDAQVKIGVRQGASGIDFHAWVTVGPEVVSDRQERVAEYQPLAFSGLPTGR